MFLTHTYTGGEELDIGKIEKSELLDPVDGFGGGTLNKTVCIPNGPFKDYVLHTGPGFENAPEGRCVERKLNNRATYGARKEYVEHCYKFEKFEQAWQCMEESGPHNAFHAGVGGEMNNPISSPGGEWLEIEESFHSCLSILTGTIDPIFYLHHTWLDKVWWDWQKRDPVRRLKDISGRKVGFSTGPGGQLPPGFPEFPGGVLPPDFDFADLLDFTGPPTWTPRPEVVADPVKLDDTLNMFKVIGNLTVRDVMDIKGGSPLCYEYVDWKDTEKGKRAGKKSKY